MQIQERTCPSSIAQPSYIAPVVRNLAPQFVVYPGFGGFPFNKWVMIGQRVRYSRYNRTVLIICHVSGLALHFMLSAELKVLVTKHRNLIS
jgi:hypothetical protein